MRTVSFQSVYESVARRHGLDPVGDAIHSDTARQIAEKVTDRALIAWQSWDFAELTRTEERAFRPVWNNTDQYLRVGEEGLPDEVFYLVNTKYYRVKTTAVSDPAAGTLPTNTTYFQEITPEPFIAQDQRCRRSLGQVIGVYKTNPSFNTYAGIDLALPFRPSEHGIRVMGDYGATVFVWYMLPPPEYTIAPYITGRTYHRGDRVFYGKPVGDGNCYRAIATTSTHAPTDTAFWVMEPVPVSLRKYLESGAYSDCLRDTIFNGVDEPTRSLRMQAAAGEAETHITRLIDNLIGQGQKHFYGGNSWLKYSGNGMWVSQPWGGDRVWTIKDACETDWIYPSIQRVEFVTEIIGVISGIAQLVEGQDYIDVNFGTAQPGPDWTPLETSIVNTTDLTPINVWPGVITNKTTTGFRLQLNGTPDSGNYFLNWSIRGLFGYYFTGPASGVKDAASSIFTVRLPDESTLEGTVIVTPHAVGGTFTPSAVALTTAAPAATFTFTPTTYGARSISVTNDRGLVDPVQIEFTGVVSTYALSGPASGASGVPSTPFTVSLPVGGAVVGLVTVTPNDSGGGGAFTPTSVQLSTASPSATFTYLPASTGSKTIGTTNTGGLTNPAPLTYVVSFLPTSFTGLALWLKADSLSLSDGDPVGTWPDQSGNGNNFVQATAGKKPLFKTAIVNSKPVLRFDGTDDGLSAVASIIPTNTTNYAIFIVCKAGSTSAGSHTLYCTGTVLTAYSVQFRRDVADWAHYHRTGADVLAGDVGGVTSGAWVQLTADWDGTNIHFWRRGVLKQTTAAATMGSASTDNAIGVYRMSGLGDGAWWDGDIAEVVIYNTALSGSDRALVEGYLISKYAL